LQKLANYFAIFDAGRPGSCAVKIRRGGYFCIRQSKNPRKSLSRGLYEARKTDPIAKKRAVQKVVFKVGVQF